MARLWDRLRRRDDAPTFIAPGPGATAAAFDPARGTGQDVSESAWPPLRVVPDPGPPEDASGPPAGAENVADHGQMGLPADQAAPPAPPPAGAVVAHVEATGVAATANSLPAAPGAAPRYLAPRVRRRRASLVRELRRQHEDLGGLVLEMIRHDRFSKTLLDRRALDLFGIEFAIHQLDSSPGLQSAMVVDNCPQCQGVCPPGARFCPGCGVSLERQ